MNWESEVRWNLAQRADQGEPAWKVIFKLRVQLWLSVILNLGLLIAVVILARR